MLLLLLLRLATITDVTDVNGATARCRSGATTCLCILGGGSCGCGRSLVCLRLLDACLALDGALSFLLFFSIIFLEVCRDQPLPAACRAVKEPAQVGSRTGVDIWASGDFAATARPRVALLSSGGTLWISAHEEEGQATGL